MPALRQCCFICALLISLTTSAGSTGQGVVALGAQWCLPVACGTLRLSLGMSCLPEAPHPHPSSIFPATSLMLLPGKQPGLSKRPSQCTPSMHGPDGRRVGPRCKAARHLQTSLQRATMLNLRASANWHELQLHSTQLHTCHRSKSSQDKYPNAFLATSPIQGRNPHTHAVQ
jgi:hypothetical protein